MNARIDPSILSNAAGRRCAHACSTRLVNAQRICANPALPPGGSLPTRVLQRVPPDVRRGAEPPRQRRGTALPALIRDLRRDGASCSASACRSAQTREQPAHPDAHRRCRRWLLLGKMAMAMLMAAMVTPLAVAGAVRRSIGDTGFGAMPNSPADQQPGAPRGTGVLPFCACWFAKQFAPHGHAGVPVMVITWFTCRWRSCPACGCQAVDAALRPGQHRGDVLVGRATHLNALMAAVGTQQWPRGVAPARSRRSRLHRRRLLLLP